MPTKESDENATWGFQSGSEIVIEERPGEEMTHFKGERITPAGIAVWNPAFDVTPSELIAGIVTEKGTALPSESVFKVMTASVWMLTFPVGSTCMAKF